MAFDLRPSVSEYRLLPFSLTHFLRSVSAYE